MVDTLRPAIVVGLRLVRLVGAGGEGEVWEVRDEQGRARALKLIRPDGLASPEEVAVRGAWLEAIDHPALVRVHATGIVDHGPLVGWGWQEMDLVRGADLAAAPADPDALDRLVPLAEALDLLHAGYWSDGVPLVHRDVKPGNLVDPPGGGLVLVDPSTLRDLDGDLDMTRIGTPLFAAPEATSGRIGPAADVYSFAATALALVTGARGRDLRRVLADPAAAGLPPGVCAALSPDARDRPASCRAVLAAGDPTVWLDVVERSAHDGAAVWPGQGAHALPSPPASGPRWPLVAALLVVLLLAAAGWEAAAAGVARVPLPRPAAALGVAAAVHAAALLLARTSPWLVLLAPPAAWAIALADRGRTRPRRRALDRAVLTALLVAVLVAAVIRPGAALPIGLAGAVAVPLALRTTGGRGTAAALGRALLAPAWLAGALLWIAGALVLLLPALVLARTRRLLRATGRVVASGIELLRRP